MQVVRSQAQTPAPSIFDVQEQIKNLLAQGQINSAFHQALVSNDLNLVEFTLEKADYKVVFNPCPLQQTVLLSLIQQIAVDLTNHNELKQKYLADAILNLNLRDPTTKEHAPKVMRELMQHCQSYTNDNPTSAHCSGLRMVMMATQGLGIKLYWYLKGDWIFLFISNQHIFEHNQFIIIFKVRKWIDIYYRYSNARPLCIINCLVNVAHIFLLFLFFEQVLNRLDFCFDEQQIVGPQKRIRINIFISL